MTAKPFLDTNILVYAALDESSDHRVGRAREVFTQGGIVSVQVLNEFVDLARRKFNHPWDRIHNLLRAIELCCGEAQPITAAVQSQALAIAARHNLRIYDATILASALESRCNILYTEDLHHGQTLEGLRIENPFLDPEPFQLLP